MDGGCSMISQVGFSVQLSMTGMTQCEFFPSPRAQENSLFFFSIRAKIRDGVDNHNAFDNYWIRCLYEGEQGDPEDVENGFLKNVLLVKV